MTEPKKFFAVPLGRGCIYEWTNESGWKPTSLEFLNGELAQRWLSQNTRLINAGRLMTITLNLSSGPMELTATIGLE